MRVLITGGAGFVGGALVARLARDGVDVHATSRSERTGPGTWHRAELTDPAAAEQLMVAVRPTHLVHAAWFQASGAARAGGADNLEWTEISLRLLREFAAAGGQRFVGLGSCFEYDWSDPVLSEDTPLGPRNLYGHCKAAIGQTSLAFGEAADVSVAWARGFFMYGPGEGRTRLVADVALSLLAGRTVATSDGLQERDFLHVDDVADGLATLLATDYRGALNLASGEAVPVRRLVEIIAGHTGGIERVEFGAIERPADDPPRLVADVIRMKSVLGWAPRISLEEGLGATVDHWRERQDT